MQKHLFSASLIFIFVCLYGCKQNRIEMKDLRCENLNDPKGITDLAPRFSWKLESTKRSQVQTAYQILVASTIENLKNNNGDMWDSKRIESDKSILINYEGRELKAATSYYWKVKVWDGEDMIRAGVKQGHGKWDY